VRSAHACSGIYATSTPFTSHTTSSPSMAHERASSTLLKVVTFASRSFSTFFAIFFRSSPNLVITVSPQHGNMSVAKRGGRGGERVGKTEQVSHRSIQELVSGRHAVAQVLA